MALFSHRPRLEIVGMPSPLLCGQECEIVLRVSCQRPVQILDLSLWVVGMEEAIFSGVRTAQRQTLRSPSLRKIIAGSDRLESGVHEYRVKLKVPATFSPSYEGSRCGTRYVVHAHLRLPFWPGRKLERVAKVGMGEPFVSYPGEALLFSSGKGEPEAKKGFLEGSLVSNVFVSGEYIRGAIALINTQFNRYTEIRVALVGKEILHMPKRREEIEVRRFSMEIDTKDPAEGESFSLAFQVPEALAPSAIAGLWTLNWSLEIVAKVRLGRDVEGSVPLVLIPRRFASQEVGIPRPPKVGSARLTALWQRVSGSFDMTFDGREIVGHRKEVSFRISREHHGRAGMRLLAKFHFPGLGLGVRIEPSSRLRSWTGLSSGHKEWDRRHLVTGRMEEQMQVFLAELSNRLCEFPNTSLNDTSAQVWVPDSGMKKRQLEGFVRQVIDLAQDLNVVRGKIPVPSIFADNEEEWEQFALRLRGTVERGDMSLSGHSLGVSVAISHLWSDDGEHKATELLATGLVRIAAEECFSVEGGNSPDDNSISQYQINKLSQAQQSQYGFIFHQARAFHCESDQVRLIIDPTCSAPLAEAKVQALVKCANSRVEHKGPYR